MRIKTVAKATLAGTVTIGALLGNPPSAHADNPQLTHDIVADGIELYGNQPEQLVTLGYSICAGITADQMAGVQAGMQQAQSVMHAWPIPWTDKQIGYYVATAVHDLCPQNDWQVTLWVNHNAGVLT